MASLNKVQLIGHLGANPDLKYTPSNRPVCNLSIATSEAWKDKQTGEKKEKTEWHRCQVWGEFAEVCAKYLAKGRQVYVEGKLQTRSYEDKNGQKKYSTEIIVSNVVFLGSGEGQGQGGGKHREERASGGGWGGHGHVTGEHAKDATEQSALPGDLDDDGIPF